MRVMSSNQIAKSFDCNIYPENLFRENEFRERIETLITTFIKSLDKQAERITRRMPVYVYKRAINF